MRLIAVFLLLTLVSCKLVIEVPGGGSVTTRSNAYSCDSNKACEIDVYDIHFNQNFLAVAGIGHEFTGWKKRERAFCGGKDGPCDLSTSDFDSYPALMPFLESDESFFLEPVFERTIGQEVAKLEFRETGYPQLTDTEGRIVGTLRRIAERGNFVNLNFEGIERTYVLKIEQPGVTSDFSRVERLAGAHPFYYDTPDCDGTGRVYSETYLQLGEDHFSSFSNEDKLIEAVGGPDGYVWILKPALERVHIGREDVISGYDPRLGVCISGVGDFSGNYLEVIPTDLEIRLPYTMDAPVRLLPNE